jgi:rhodanese-related sulfurtransferase
MHSIKEIDVAELHARLNGADGSDLILVDVRTPAETARGAIQGARHIPLHMLPLSEHELPHKNDTAVVFYCQSGVRSAQACAFMSLRGRANVYNLRGGFQAWQQGGRPAG